MKDLKKRDRASWGEELVVGLPGLKFCFFTQNKNENFWDCIKLYITDLVIAPDMLQIVCAQINPRHSGPVRKITGSFWNEAKDTRVEVLRTEANKRV